MHYPAANPQHACQKANTYTAQNAELPIIACRHLFLLLCSCLAFACLAEHIAGSKHKENAEYDIKKLTLQIFRSIAA